MIVHEEANGTITLTIVAQTAQEIAASGQKYAVSQTNFTSAVMVVDNDGTNVLPIISVAADSVEPIIESTTATETTANFTISSDTAITSANGLEVDLVVSDGESDFIGTPVETVLIPTGATEVPLQISTVADDVEESDGQIYVTILSDMLDPNNQQDTIMYIVNPDQNSATVTVWDDDRTAPIEVGISAITSNPVEEGNDAVFQVLTKDGINVPEPEVLRINVQLSQEGDFANVSLGHQVVEIPVGQNSGELRIATHDDIIDESDGSITATLLFGEGYRIQSANRSAMVEIEDGDTDSVTGVPILSVTPSTVSVISEADTANFLITANTAPADKLTVRIAVSDGDGDFLASNQEPTVEFPDGETTFVHMVALDDDNVDEIDGVVTLTLLDDNADTTTYAVAGSSSGQASIFVNDNDDLPEISVEAITSSVIEGVNTSFRIRASRASSIRYDDPSTPAQIDTKLRINLAIGGNVNEFVNFDSMTESGGLPSYIEIVSGETEATLVIRTVDDQIDEQDGVISVSILPGAFYQVADESFTATATINDNDLPILSIVGGDEITEGDVATFELSMNPAPSEVVMVDVALTQTGNFIDLPENIKIVSVEIGKNGSGRLLVETVGDEQDEFDGTIIATIRPDSNVPPRFQPAFSSTLSPFASVSVKDDDVDTPRVSISTRQVSPIEEGRSFIVEVSADPAPESGSPLEITLATDDNLGYFDSFSANPIQITDATPVKVTVNTVDDDLDRDNGVIAVRVVDTSTYIAASSPNNIVSVNVTDNEYDLPVVSITSVTDRSMIEGEQRGFRLNMVPPPQTGYRQFVELEVTESVPGNNFLNQVTPNPVEIDSTGVALGLLMTTDDEVYESDGEITVSVKGIANEYRPASAPNNAVTFNVSDNDYPTISVTDFIVLEEASDSSYNLEFTLSAPLNDAVVVDYSLATTGNEATHLLDFELDGSSPHRVSLDVGATMGQIPITILADDFDDPREDFNLILTSTSARFENGTVENGVATTQVTGTIAELPVISITSNQVRVADSDYFGYTISAEPSLTDDITVLLDVTDATLGIVPDTDEAPTAELTATQLSVDKQLIFDTSTNAADDTLISVAIRANANYIINPNRNLVEVRVDSDEDLPVVSVSGGGDVNEGGVATFTVSVDDQLDNNGVEIPRTNPLVINFKVTEVGTNYLSEVPVRTITIQPDATQFTYSISTMRDEADGANGTITATVEPGPGYTLGEVATRSADVSVLNDTTFPVITFNTENNSQMEGTDIVFPFTLDNPSDGSVVLAFAVNDGAEGTTAILGTDYSLSDTSPITVADQASTGSITISTVADNYYEGIDENFTITITATNAVFADNSNTMTLEGII